MQAETASSFQSRTALNGLIYSLFSTSVLQDKPILRFLQLREVVLPGPFCSLQNLHNYAVVDCSLFRENLQGVPAIIGIDIEIGKLPDVDFDHDFDFDTDSESPESESKSALVVLLLLHDMCF